MADNSFYGDLYRAFIYGGAYCAVGYAASYLIFNTTKHSDEIKKLNSRLKECEKKHESSQD